METNILVLAGKVWKIGDRVVHPEYGAGTIAEIDPLASEYVDPYPFRVVFDKTPDIAPSDKLRFWCGPLAQEPYRIEKLEEQQPDMLPDYLIRALKNALTALEEKDFQSAEKIIRFVVREIENGDYKLIS